MKRRWGWGLHAVALAAGAAHIWLHRFVMNPDGVSYLDLAERFANGDFAAALNAYWSPLLPALLGVTLRAVRPTPASEFPLAHAVNFALYAGAYAAFLRFVRELEQLERAPGDLGSDGSPHATTSFGRQVCYTGLFLWAALGLADPALVVPDLAALMIGLLAAAQLLRVAAGRGGAGAPIRLGALLGLGYLARAAFFPIGLIWLALGYAAVRRQPLQRRRYALAPLAFGAIMAPLIIALSLETGRLTFGESGRINYVWYVNQERGAGLVAAGADQSLVHPVRVLPGDPPVYEFGSPVRGTYPIWADPSYWNDGIAPRFEPSRQWDVLRHHLGVLARIGAPLLSAGVLLLLLADRRTTWSVARPALAVVVACVAGAVIYALIHLERRHVAGFALVVSLVAAAAFRPARHLSALGLIVGLGLLIGTLATACGTANFVCGTGTTTPTMLTIGVGVLAVALAARAARRTGLVSIRDAGGAAVAVTLILGAKPDALVLTLTTALLALLLVLPVDGSRPVLEPRWAATGAAAWLLVILLGPLMRQGWISGGQALAGRPPVGVEDVATADSLANLGVRPTSRVASIGNTFEAFWARLARVTIVAEIPQYEAGAFWQADSAAQASALDRMATSGATAVVAEWRGTEPLPRGWTRVDQRHLMRWLPVPTAQGGGAEWSSRERR